MEPFTITLHEPEYNLELEVSIYPPDAFTLHTVWLCEQDITSLLSREAIDKLHDFIQSHIFEIIRREEEGLAEAAWESRTGR